MGQDAGARDRAAGVAHDARDEAASVAATAQQEAGRVADEVRHQTKDLAEDAKQQLRHQAEAQTENLGRVMGEVSDHLRALADGRPEEAGGVRSLAESVAGQMERIADRMDQLGFEGVVDEVQRYARRRPGAFLAGAAALGFAVSRLAQGAKADAQVGSTSRSPGTISGPDQRGRAPDRVNETLPPSTTAPGGLPPSTSTEPNIVPDPVGRGAEV